MEMMRFESYFFQLRNGTPVFRKRFLVFRKSDSKLKSKTFKTSTDCHIKHADLSNGDLFQKLRDCNKIRTHNHLVRERTLSHLTKLAKYGTVHLAVCFDHVT